MKNTLVIRRLTMPLFLLRGLVRYWVLPNSLYAGGGDVNNDAIAARRIDEANVVGVLNQTVDVLNTKPTGQLRIALFYGLQNLKSSFKTISEVGASDVNQDRRARQTHIHVACECKIDLVNQIPQRRRPFAELFLNLFVDSHSLAVLSNTRLCSSPLRKSFCDRRNRALLRLGSNRLHVRKFTD